jgi:pimeloyl-ACP methyl ester carboxylesterase
LQIPGYGDSSPSTLGYDKRAIGRLILEALDKHLKSYGSKSSTHSIVLIGHDRGARVIHRIAVDRSLFANFDIRSVVLLDIVPTVVQFESFAQAKPAVGSFHWTFLANVEIAVPMIKAIGGDIFIKQLIKKWAGKTEAKCPIDDDALEVYGSYFKNETNIRAACEDYRAGATEDIDQQIQDQKDEKKIDIPTTVIYSETYIGSRYNVKEVWSNWVTPGTYLETIPIGHGAGHFLPEEQPAETIAAIRKGIETGL